MNVLKSSGEVRLLAALISFLALAACGQQDQPAAMTAADDVALPDKVPVTTSSQEARILYVEGLALADNLHFIEANEAFAKAVEIDPEDKQSARNLTTLRELRGKFF